MSKRALRRHHRQRIISKWYREHPVTRGEFAAVNEAEWRFHAARVHARTRTPCSCMMCGNPRKFYGNKAYAKTRQEMIATLRSRDEE